MSTNINVSSPQILFSRALEMGLQPTWLNPGVLFAIQTPAGEKFINSGVNTLNSHVSSNLSSNKFNTRLILERHGLPNIPYLRTRSMDEAQEFLETHTKVVVKPIKGSNSHDIHILTSLETFQDKNIFDYILEKYTPGREMRYLVLNGEVIAVHESKYGDSVAEDRALERISFAEEDWVPELADMAVTVAGIMRLNYAAVDFMIDDTGETHILEVNCSPGLRLFHYPTAGPSVDLAHKFLTAMMTSA